MSRSGAGWCDRRCDEIGDDVLDVVVTMGRWTPRAVALESNASIGSSSVGVGGVGDGVWGCPVGGSVVVVPAAVFVFVVVVRSGVGVDGSVSSDPPGR